MALRFRCLLLDHDDTAVRSTEDIHYPAHLESLRVLRPEKQPPGMEQWLLANFHGIMNYLEGELKLTTAEMEQELEIWRRFTTRRQPEFFPGFLETLADFRRKGGKVAVISHSEEDVIAGHYRRAKDPMSFPDLIFGWTNEERKRKPSPWPVRQALARFGLKPHEALIVDDLKPGILMSQAAGVAFAAAGWSHNVGHLYKPMF